MPEVPADTLVSNEDLNLRPLNCELNVLSRPDGSAMLTQGETSVAVGVYGPVEVKLNRIIIEKASIEVMFRPKSGLQTVTDRLREDILQRTFEAMILSSQYPRTCISITVQEMQDCGGLLACAINTSCLALINSGVALKFLVAAVHCIIKENGTVVLDPDEKQCKEAVATLTFAFDSVDKNVITSHSSGKFQESQFQEALFKCQTASRKIFQYYHDIVQKYVPTMG